MDKNTANAIKRARLQMGLTQEKAAELSGYSVDSIQAWEGGTRRPSFEALAILEDTYYTPWLTTIYLREQYQDSLGAAIPEFVPGEPLPKAVLALLDAVYELRDTRSDRELVTIAADGRITQEERAVYDEIMERLQRVVEAAMAVKFAKHE